MTAAKKPAAKKPAAKQAAAKKPAAKKPTAKQAASSPFETAGNVFVDACEATIGEMLRAAGFGAPQTDVTQGELRARYTREASAIEVASERFGEPWVVVHVKPGLSFGLHTFAAELEPDWFDKRPHKEKTSLSSAEMREALADLAGLIGRHLPTLLAPSEDLIGRLRERVRAAVWAQ
ncbi:MAG: hypothetical protein U0271_42135 [Polyangiaceae bacterium]